MKSEFFYDIEQGSDAWAELRRGRITSSEFRPLLAAGEGREKLIRRCAAEIYSGKPTESYSNAWMERGKAQEAEALAKYALVRDVEPIKCGFVSRGRTGCSPDSLIGKTSGVQIKTMRQDLLIDVLLRNEAPTEHIAQVQGEMMVTGRKTWDLAIYSPGMPLFLRTINYDAAYGARIEDALERAYLAVDTLVKRIQGYRS